MNLLFVREGIRFSEMIGTATKNAPKQYVLLLFSTVKA